MSVIYEPKGRAREYSDLACNLYLGCTHGCAYCYAPACMRKTSEAWHQAANPRKDILLQFEKDARRLEGDSRAVLFCFLTDPYQPAESTYRLTRSALEIAYQHGLKSKILTKGMGSIIAEDLPFMKEAKTELGLTITFVDDEKRREWEPFASSIDDRMKTLEAAHSMGIYTWVSLEPVIDPQEALEVIERAHPFVSFWKIGKLNHMKAQEDQVDWAGFLSQVKKLIKSKKAKAYIKADLAAFEN